MIRERRGRAIVFCIALALAVVFACVAAVRTPAMDNTALTLRTDDGLVLIDGNREVLSELAEKLSAMGNPPAGSRGLFRWLIANSVSSGSIRLYSSVSKTGKGRGMQGPSIRRMTVGDAVAAGEVPCITGRKLYEAYMLIRATGARMYLMQGPETSSGVSFPRTVFIMSSAYWNGQDGIYVDGENVSNGVMGYNVVLFSTDGARVTAAGGFRLFDDPEESGRMADFLNSGPQGTYVAAAVKFGPGVFLAPDAVGALHACGSKESLDPEILSSHAVFGRKGWKSGDSLEKSRINLGTDVIIFGNELYVEESSLDAGFIGPGGRMVVIGGTREQDSLIIIE